MTVKVMWKLPAWVVTFQRPRQTVTIRIASQGIFVQRSSFQISHLIITVKFTSSWSSCNVWKHQVLLINSDNYLSKKLNIF